MSIPLWVSRSGIIGEFSDEEQNKYFSLKEKKFIADIDNYYYTVFLTDDVFGDEFNHKIDKFIEDLTKLREEYDIASADKLDFMGLDYYPFGLKFYNNRLSLDECYDILICSTLPNNKTPRIMVQLRARYLWIEGTKKCIKTSFKKVEKILKQYGLKVHRVQVNRVDYAFHNNAVQSPEKYFDRTKLDKFCATRSRIYNIVGDPLQNWSIDYLSVGSRNSKSVFFRFYNKSREVVEQNYKSFFINLWFENGLISEYDRFCLERAFILRSYDVGLCIARIEWYLQFGHNEELKSYLSDLLKTCYEDNDNSTEIRKTIKGLLPEVTTITNIEYETHSDFYRSFHDSISKLNVETDTAKNKLFYVLQVYDCRKAYIDYLTSYGNVVAFMRDVKVIPGVLKEARNSFKKDKEGYKKWKAEYIESQYLDFWKRLRRTKLGTKYKPELYRSYSRNIDIERAKRKIVSSAAVLSIVKNGINENDVDMDFSDVFSLLNDNDMHDFLLVDQLSGEVAKINYADYDAVKKRKNRQYRGIVSSPGRVDS